MRKKLNTRLKVTFVGCGQCGCQIIAEIEKRVMELDGAKDNVSFAGINTSNLVTDVPMINNTNVTQTVPITINIEGNADQNTVNVIKEMLPREMKKYATGKMWSDISTAGIRYRR